MMPSRTPVSPKVESTQYRRRTTFRDIPADLLAQFDATAPCGAANLRCAALGLEGWLSPLRAFGDPVWDRIVSRCSDAYFVNDRSYGTPSNPGHVTAILPIEVGFVAVRISKDMPADEIHLDHARGALIHGPARLPEFLNGAARLADLIGIHFNSEYIGNPDVCWFKGEWLSGTHLVDDIRGNLRRKATAIFGKRWEWELRSVASAMEHPWQLFIDNGEASEGALWVALDESFKDVRRLVAPQAGYEAMLLHYLDGNREPFDFLPYSDTKSIW